jgi:ATP-binding cassette, subfamily G (WHITE), member 2, SNQ2
VIPSEVPCAIPLTTRSDCVFSIHGVSGGERKRVSIAEALVTRAAVLAWDNSTRGLEASTALDYALSLKLLSQLQRTSATLATLYQVSDTIYECFDRILVMDEGLAIYYGPTPLARQYFHDLGYFMPSRQATADFLTSITDPNEVQFREGFENRAPRTAAEREKAWKSSESYRALKDEMAEYDREVFETGAFRPER